MPCSKVSLSTRVCLVFSTSLCLFSLARGLKFKNFPNMVASFLFELYEQFDPCINLEVSSGVNFITHARVSLSDLRISLNTSLFCFTSSAKSNLSTGAAFSLERSLVPLIRVMKSFAASALFLTVLVLTLSFGHTVCLDEGILTKVLSP